MRVSRWVLSAVIVVIAVLLQVSVVERIEIRDASPDLVVLVVVSIGLLEGSIIGAISGFGAGLATGLFAGILLGPHAMIATLIGYASGRWGESLVTDEHPAPPLIAGVVATFVMEIGRPLVEFLVNPAVTTTSGMWGEALVVTALNALLAIPVYVLVRRTLRIGGDVDLTSVRDAGGDE